MEEDFEDGFLRSNEAILVSIPLSEREYFQKKKKRLDVKVDNEVSDVPMSLEEIVRDKNGENKKFEETLHLKEGKGYVFRVEKNMLGTYISIRELKKDPRTRQALEGNEILKVKTYIDSYNSFIGQRIFVVYRHTSGDVECFLNRNLEDLMKYEVGSSGKTMIK